ncbi:MAG: sugar ABC transporter permease [Acutalibacteraceae bacterium]|jgi:ABC-type sugar transport system permease subunit|nr:sugar ABC transporter permease [Acutalibacteraceae bacterium]
MNNKVKRKNLKTRLFGREANWYAYIFLLPWIVGIALLVIRPLVLAIYYSFCEVGITGRGISSEWIGWKNFQDIWVRDINFIDQELSFLIKVILQVPIIVIFALLAALMLNTNLKGKGIFRTIFFLPVIVVSGPIINELQGQGATAVSTSDQMIVNQVISSFLPEWLVEPISGLFAQLILILWYSGIQIIMFLAILQKIDLNMIEAAKIDGATGWEIFWKITLPAIRSIILLNAVYTLVYLANSSSNGVIDLISRAMIKTRGYGYASSMAWMHSIVVLVLLGLIFLLLKNKPDQFLKNQKRKLKEQRRREREKRRWLADAEKRADA